MKLDLNYKPTPLCDTEGMPESEWLAMRDHGPFYADPSDPRYVEHGIGGSSISIIEDVNPWQTSAEYWHKLHDKIEYDPPVNTASKVAGHVWEDYVAKMIPCMAGMEGTKVVNDTTFYQHPLFPFMLANLDRRIILPDGSEGIGEIKTTNFRNYETIKNWKAGIVPAYYEMQCRWYMSIMNKPFAYIICAWGFTTNDMVMLRIDRDLKEEARLIGDAIEFLDSIKKGIPPTIENAKTNKLALISLGKIFGAGDSALPPVEVADTRRNRIAMSKIEQLLSEKKELNSRHNEEIRNLDEQIAYWSKGLLEKLGKSEEAVLHSEDIDYILKYKTTIRNTLDSKKLQEEHPDIFDKVKKTSFSRALSVSATENKKV